MATQFPSDDELLFQFQQKETKEKAFEQIIKKYQERLYWHVRRMVVDHSDADDVLQNTFIKVWKYLDNFRGDSKLYTWLFRVATNESITFINKQKKRAVTSIDQEDQVLINKLKGDADFDAKKAEWKLQMAIQTLPEKQKAVFNLRYYDEMPYEEMSKVLDTSVGALKANYHHAAKKVEEYILNH